MKANDIGLGQGGARGIIGYMAAKINDIDNTHDIVSGIKVAKETYEEVNKVKENYREPKININPNGKEYNELEVVNATTDGFFQGPGLTELADFEQER